MREESRVWRPLSFGDLFDEVFSLYRQNFLLFVGITGVVYIPFEVLSQLLTPHPLERPFTPEQAAGATNTLLAGGLLLLVAALLSQAALTKAIGERYLGQPTSVATAYGFALQRFFPFLGTLILMGLAFLAAIFAAAILGFVLGLILFWLAIPIMLLPIIITAIWLAFVFPVFVVENRAFFDAMGRSRELAKGNWRRIFLVWLIVILLSLIVGSALALFSVALFGPFPTGLQAVLAGIITGLAEALAVPIGLTAFVLLYFDIRVRKEGFDLHILAQEMAARSGTAPITPPPPPSPP
jgi:hypothetical protein